MDLTPWTHGPVAPAGAGCPATDLLVQGLTPLATNDGHSVAERAAIRAEHIDLTPLE